MNCNKCNATLEDDALYCSSCGDQFAANEQKEKVNEAFANTRNIISKQIKSPIFLAVAILFSVITASQIVSMLWGGFSEIFAGILPLVFMVIGVVGFWTAYTAKSYESLAGSLRKASIFDAYTRVMHTISAVLLCIAGVLSVVLVALISVLGETIAEAIGFEDVSEAASDLGIVAAIVVFVVFAIIVTVVLIFRGIYAKRRRYFLALSETAETCNYTAAKAPVIGSYILGGFDVLGAIFSIGLAFSVRSVVYDMFGSFLTEFGLMESVDSLLSTFTSSLAISGISSIISGAYLVLSALWMFNVHKAEDANRTVLMAECARLEEIENSVRAAAFAASEVNCDENAEEINVADEESKCEVDIPVLEEITVEDAVEELSAEEKAETVE